MRLTNYNVYFFFVVLGGITALTFFLVKSFLVPFLIAAILAHLFSSFFGKILKLTKRKGVSAFLTCLFIALLIVLPLVFVSFLVVDEAQNIVAYVSSNPQAVQKIVSEAAEKISAVPLFKYVGVEKFTTQEGLLPVVKSLSSNIITLLQGAYQGVAHFVFVTFLMFFSLFYLLIDGERIIKKIMQMSPLQDKYEKILVDSFNSITRATIKGTTLIAIIQGLMGGILFLVSGTPSPVLLGILMALSSVIPSVGSGLIWLPVGVGMIIAGKLIPGIAILVVGGFLISTIDNVLRPRLVGKDTQMHPLLILFSTLGGLTLFGISGFIVGPVIMALFVALWEIYALEFKSQLAEYNK